MPGELPFWDQASNGCTDLIYGHLSVSQAPHGRAQMDLGKPMEIMPSSRTPNYADVSVAPDARTPGSGNLKKKEDMEA